MKRFKPLLTRPAMACTLAIAAAATLVIGRQALAENCMAGWDLHSAQDRYKLFCKDLADADCDQTGIGAWNDDYEYKKVAQLRTCMRRIAQPPYSETYQHVVCYGPARTDRGDCCNGATAEPTCPLPSDFNAWGNGTGQGP